MSIDLVKTQLTNNKPVFGLPFDWQVGISDEVADSQYHNPVNPCAGIITKVEQLPVAGLVREDTLDTAVILSLFSDARAGAETYLPPGVTDRRGWCGDEFVNRAAQPWGSLIWTRLFTKANKQRYATTDAVDKFIAWTARESLQHLIDDGVASNIEVETAWLKADKLGLYIDIYRGNNLTAPYQSAWGFTLQEAANV